MARALLKQRVMLSHHDTTTLPTGRDELPRGLDVACVATFLKPQFRIGVTPASGELKVHVELRSAETRTRPFARH